MGPSGRTKTGVANEEAAAAVLAAIDVGVLAIDRTGLGLYANPAWVSLTGQAGATWRGAGWQSLLSGADGDRKRFLDGLLVGDSSLAVEVRVPLVPGRVLHLDVVQPDDARTGAAAVVTARDVSEERALEAVLAQAAQRDALTGLWNRGRFVDFLAHALTLAEREHERRAAVFFIDVDELKGTNDRDGHAAGDRLLQHVAECLTAAVRPGDVVARFGGDEFTVLCDDVDDVEVRAIADRVLAAIDASVEVACTVSLGVAVSSGATDDPNDIIARADADMYRAKRRDGRSAARTTPSDSRPAQVELVAPEVTELVWALGAFVRLLHDRWPAIAPDEVHDVLAAAVRLQARLEAALLDQR